jgi:DNA-binding transcriptional regulator YiaG
MFPIRAGSVWQHQGRLIQHPQEMQMPKVKNPKPKKSKKKNESLKQLRKILKKKYAEFGRMVGCSRDTIKSLETGRNKLSTRAAMIINLATGASVRSLIRGDGELKVCRTFQSAWRFHKMPERANWNYEKGDFEWWNRFRPDTYGSVSHHFQILSVELAKCLFAVAGAESAGAKGKRLTMVGKIGWMLEDTRRQFQVEPHLAAVLKDPLWNHPETGVLAQLQTHAADLVRPGAMKSNK